MLTIYAISLFPIFLSILSILGLLCQPFSCNVLVISILAKKNTLFKFANNLYYVSVRMFVDYDFFLLSDQLITRIGQYYFWQENQTFVHQSLIIGARLKTSPL